MLEVQPSDLEQIGDFSWPQGNFHPSLQLTVKSHKLKHKEVFVHVHENLELLHQGIQSSVTRQCSWTTNYDKGDELGHNSSIPVQ